MTDSDGYSSQSGCAVGYTAIKSYCQRIYPNLVITDVTEAKVRSTSGVWCNRENVDCEQMSNRRNYHCVGELSCNS